VSSLTTKLNHLVYISHILLTQNANPTPPKKRKQKTQQNDKIHNGKKDRQFKKRKNKAPRENITSHDQ